MGLETLTTAHKGRSKYEGKLHLDSKTLKFSGKDFKWSASLGPDLKVSSRGTRLSVSSGTEKIVFEIGDKVDRWVDKILNPPSLLDKLAVKPGMRCWLSKGFRREFAAEIRARGASITRQLDRCDLAFCFVADRQRLDELVDVCFELAAGINVWAVYPKGASTITQGDVMKTMKQIGFGPSKTAAFDDHLSSMRYAKKR
ncbi:MAG: hypothetical protein AAF456_03205 [Planctomycetota bacterium]